MNGNKRNGAHMDFDNVENDVIQTPSKKRNPSNAKKFSVMDYINQIEFVLAELRPSTYWKAVRPECIANKDVLSIIRQIFIITLGHATGGERLDNLSFEGIDELLVDKALSEDEIIDVALETPVSKERSDKDEEKSCSKSRFT
ncbi:hypothetical protein CEXT_729011 [Caerostris extrusa]|uniref:Uncharacterized protein n=1 Tax=Caerostris extrusa TaxID=172846 RepID=A0AAV4N564_CAEEX|nr:hypothetical protein CEXT_729011 [Caerostris extrusa]